jgi:hemerythrin-like domain-containing protein
VAATLFPSPGAGFDQPFEMLYACHERVQRSLDLLARLVVHVREHGADAQAGRAAQDVMRYFDIAAPHHHEDEERHVFPRLDHDERLRAAVARLRSEHAAIGRLWQVLRPLLDAVATRRADVDAAALASAAQAFIDIPDEHVRTENELVFPAAEALVRTEGSSVMDSIGDEMARRRGALR